jgi:peptide/nickel transport system substrate-binding protein
VIPGPEAWASDNPACLAQDMPGAMALLDEAGWKDTDGDGIRDKDGKKLKLLYQTTVNPIRQDFQALIKDWWTELGVEVELKAIDPGVFFGGDAGSPDTFQKFYADVEMYANNSESPDPESYLGQYQCKNAPSPETQWQGENINRFCTPEYDALYATLATTTDIAARQDIAKKLNDMVTKDSMIVVPLVHRGTLSAHSNALGGVQINAWDSELWNVADWFRVK